MKKNRMDLLKKQFAVFRALTGKTLEEIITRYYHLVTELENYKIEHTTVEMTTKILDALPSKWEVYTLLIKENPEFATYTLDDVIGSYEDMILL